MRASTYEPSRYQEDFARERANDYGRVRVVRVPGQTYVFVIGENQLVEGGAWRPAAVWLVMDDGFALDGRGELEAYEEHCAQEEAWEAEVAHATEVARGEAAGEFRCRYHPEVAATSAASGLCEFCEDDDWEAREESRRDGVRERREMEMEERDA